MVAENIHSHPIWKLTGISDCEGGLLKRPKFSKKSMKLNWNLDNVRYYIIIQNMHVMHDLFQISVSDDYQSWYETMCAEFPSRFTRLFQGPPWSGTAINEQKDPVTVSGGGLLLLMISKMKSFREYNV